jgi:hypothetical protein
MSAQDPRCLRARLVRAAPWLVLALGLAAQAWIGLRWVRLDQSVAEGVFPYGAWPLVQLLDRLELGQLAMYLDGSAHPDLFSFTGLIGRAIFGQRPDSLLLTILALTLATQLLLAILGRQLGSPWGGVLAALLLPLAPDSGVMARRWAAQLPHMFLLTACAACLIRSRSFTRWLPGLGFVTLAVIGMIYSPWLTDDVLFVGAVGAMALGAGARGLLLGRGPHPEPALSRLRVLAGGVVAAALLALAGWQLMFRWLDLGYYVLEAGDPMGTQVAPPGSWTALSGYLRLMWADLYGPWLCVAALVGLPLFAWRGRGRAELLGWALLCLVVLSVVTKKNSYYLVVLYPVVPLVLSLGLDRLPRAWLRGLAMVAVLVPAWWSWQARSFVPFEGPPPRIAQYDPAFQTVNPPVLGFRGDRPYARELRLLESSSAAFEALDEPVLCIMPLQETAELELAIEPLLPHARVRNNPVMAPCDFLLLRRFEQAPGELERPIRSVSDFPDGIHEILQRRPFTLLGSSRNEPPVLYLLQQER